ncbi:pyridoxamine 5'-phosphate oxidase family protein [Candidatus Uhrbacteria bacterium]|nr:pyridoxamine 5'-phosphate oxidase family protein [Candidatus Uhrbacteria bacterium]
MPSSPKFQWSKYIKEALDRTEFMALGTFGADGSWVCPVQFSYDEKMSLYFKSIPVSRHMKNISANPQVSVAIYSTVRLPNDEVVGIQLKGSAQILMSEAEVEQAAKYHYGRSEPHIDHRSRVQEHIGKDATWNFVKITPTEVWYFDTRLFDEETQGRQLVHLSFLDLKI